MRSGCMSCTDTRSLLVSGVVAIDRSRPGGRFVFQVKAGVVQGNLGIQSSVPPIC